MLVQDRYQVFLHVIWEWHHVRMLKRHGRGNDPTGAKGTGHGECVVRCLACPWPGVNMGPEKSLKDVNWDTLDNANFRLIRLNVSNDICDPGLNHGYAFFVEETAFQQHLKDFADRLPCETNTCNNHDAIKLSALRGKGTAASGVGAIVCARHDMWRPCSVTDLHKGEDYLHMDYCVLSSLQHDTPCDIWGVNFWERVGIYGGDLVPVQTPDNITFLVPKFHLAAHIEKCQRTHSFNKTPGVGQTDGEAPERTWASSNLIASSTKEMGPGSQRDTLDDHFNDHNWRKVITFVVILLRRIKDTVPECASSKDSFDVFCERLSSDNLGTVSRWTQEIEAWETGQSAENPFEWRVKVLTVTSVWLCLAEEESKKLTGTTPTSLHSSITMISIPMFDYRFELQCNSKGLGSHVTDLQWAKLLERGNQLQRDIEHWTDIQHVYIPQVWVIRAKHERSRAGEQIAPWELDLLMPSALLRDHCTDVESELMEFEWDFHVAQAEESLDELRRKIILETYVLDYKKAYGHGQRQGTKSAKLLKNCQASKTRCIATYQHARSAMEALSSCITRLGWRAVYQPLDSDDARLALTNNAEALRLEWLNSRARAQHWAEECLLLQEEMQPEQWKKCVEMSVEGMNGGARAFALRQSSLRMAMHDNCAESWSSMLEWLTLGLVPDRDIEMRDGNSET
ncbi:hypothetical protein ARMSODRAFT_991298 [Armillaria solidipes]|uniref:CxC2-like cysteine cluster KDZ transposase-associated domain-containing protein n=1 Tax=Armillaria solidipes TaxID=1076256 RepID=A0A2H3AU54_9AGAR|nr:hypothetical protein ARMSODRAFT_991298 [Armillaria solidipes]